MKLLVNASFVGGFGAIRKLLSFQRALAARNIEYELVTDSGFAQKLTLFGISAQHVIPLAEGNARQYMRVQKALADVDYDAMVSFGWRTFVPTDAVEKDRPCVIIDGGWPEVLEEWPSPFCLETYQELRAYCLTSHFSSPGLSALLPQNSGIPFLWISQPFSPEEVEGYAAGQGDKESLVQDFPELGQGHERLVFLSMSPDYLDPWQLDHAGGWMSAQQVDECLGFVTRLVVELDQQPGTLLFMLEGLRQQVAPTLARTKNLRVFSRKFLDPELHHGLRCAADLVICRAIRDVSSAQLALSGQKVLHAICPARGDYMGEAASADVAQGMNIARRLRHEEVPLAQGILDYLESPSRDEVAARAQEVALSFWQERGVDYLLSLLS